MKWSYLLTRDAWDLNELKNQSAHFVIGAAVGRVTKYFFGVAAAVAVVTAMAVIIEVLQYYFTDNRKLKLPDRVRDIIFYQLGCIAAICY